MSTTINKGMVDWTINGIRIDNSIKSNPANYNNCSSREVSYIVIHYTGNPKDSAKSNAIYFKNGSRSASATFFCDEENICQSVELRDSAWHCGCSKGYKTACRNVNSIGIEMCTSGNYIVSEKTQINSAYLCAKLCNIIGISTSTVDKYVLRHYDVVLTNKLCPAQFVNDSEQWIRFKTWVKNILKTGNHEDSTIASNTTTILSSTQTNEFKVKVTVSALNIRSGAGTKYNVVGTIKDKGTYTITKTSGNWGYLKSGTGWINISSSYVKKI